MLELLAIGPYIAPAFSVFALLVILFIVGMFLHRCFG